MRGDSFHFIPSEGKETTEGGGKHAGGFDGNDGSGGTGVVPLTVNMLLPAVQSAREADVEPSMFDTLGDLLG